MRQRRWPWCVTAGLMLAAATATAWSIYLHWLPCRGALLSGSALRGYAYGPDFSDACLHRMDTGLPFPYPPEPAEQTAWASELAVVAMVLVAVAWLVVVLAMRWPLRSTAVAALPSVPTLIVAAVAVVAIGTPDRSEADFVSLWLWLSIDVATVAALAALWRWQPELRGGLFRRLVVVLWGTTAFSFVHVVSEYTFMLGFSDANWDMPPLTGYLTAATIAVTAVVTVVMTLRRPRSAPTAEVSGDPVSALTS